MGVNLVPMIIAINASAKACKDAKIAHELFTIDTIIVHLLTLCFSVYCVGF